jgi:hypothetical protein
MTTNICTADGCVAEATASISVLSQSSPQWANMRLCTRHRAAFFRAYQPLTAAAFAGVQLSVIPPAPNRIVSVTVDVKPPTTSGAAIDGNHKLTD